MYGRRRPVSRRQIGDLNIFQKKRFRADDDHDYSEQFFSCESNDTSLSGGRGKTNGGNGRRSPDGRSHRPSALPPGPGPCFSTPPVRGRLRCQPTCCTLLEVMQPDGKRSKSQNLSGLRRPGGTLKSKMAKESEGIDRNHPAPGIAPNQYGVVRQGGTRANNLEKLSNAVVAPTAGYNHTYRTIRPTVGLRESVLANWRFGVKGGRKDN